MSKDAVEARILESWPLVERFAYRYAETCANVPEASAALPVNISMCLPTVLAKRVAISKAVDFAIAWEKVQLVAKLASYASTSQMVILKARHGEEAESFDDYKTLKVIGETCDQFNKFDISKSALLAIKIYNCRQKIADSLINSYADACFYLLLARMRLPI